MREDRHARRAALDNMMAMVGMVLTGSVPGLPKNDRNSPQGILIYGDWEHNRASSPLYSFLLVPSNSQRFDMAAAARSSPTRNRLVNINKT